MLISPTLALALAAGMLAGQPPTPPSPPPQGAGLWGYVVCTNADGGCDLDAGVNGATPRSDSSPHPPRRPAAGAVPTCWTSAPLEGGLRDLWVTQNRPLRPGERVVVHSCEGGVAEWRVLDPPGAAAAAADPAQVAVAARDRLTLPAVRVRSSPAGPQLVGLPTWLWIDQAGWEPVSRTVGVPGVSVTATARPVSVVWSTGDGGAVQCAGPGTPYTSGGDPAATSPDCGHTYTQVSPAGGFTVSATVRWSVSWSGAGEAGVFPGLESTDFVVVNVVDAPAVNVTPGGAR